MTEKAQITTVGSVLSTKCVFGLNGDTKQCIDLMDEKSMVYSAGSLLVLQSLESDKTQTYGVPHRQHPTVTALTLSPGRTFVAVARKGHKIAQIFLLNPSNLRELKKSQILMDEQTKAMFPDFYCLAWSQKEDRIYALSNQKDPVLSCWSIEASNQLKLQQVVSLKGFDCLEILVNPNKPDVVSVIGKGTFKIIKFADDGPKIDVSGLNLRKETPTNFICHTWQSAPNTGLVACSSEGYIYVIKEGGDIQYVLEPNEQGRNKIISPICIVPITDGFILGGENLSIQRFYKGDSDYYYAEKDVRIVAAGEGLIHTSVVAIKVDQLEDRLLCLTNGRAVYSTMLKSDLRVAFLDEGEAKNAIQSKFELISYPGHCDRIIDMDCCVRKPLVATCSADKSVKIWDFDKKELLVTYNFSEEPYSIAFHPSGLHIAISFPDKISLFNLYLKSADNPRSFKEYAIKAGRCLKFNHGGDILAVASGETPPEICLFKFYDYGLTHYQKYKGHTGVIRSLVWAPDDHSIFSCGLQGLVYRWSIRDGEKKETNAKKIAPVNDMCLSLDSGPGGQNQYSILLAVEDQEGGSLREITGNSITRCEQGPVFQTIAKSLEKKMIFAGAKDSDKGGAIYFYRHPLSTPTESTFAHNSSGVSKLVLAPRDRYLISAGNDGVVIVFEVDDKDARAGPGLAIEFREPCPYALISQGDLNNLRQEEQTAKAQFANETTQGTGNLDMTMGSTVDTSKNTEFMKMKSENQEKVDSLRRELESKEEERKKQLESQQMQHKNSVKEMENYSTQILGEKQARLKELEKKAAISEQAFQSRLKELERKHNDDLRNIKNQFEKDLAIEEAEKKRIENEIKQTKEAHDDELEKIQQVGQEELNDVEDEYEEKIAELKKQLIKIKNEYQSNEKKMAKNRQKENELKDDTKENKAKLQYCQKQNRQLREEIANLESKLKEKNLLITASEKRIYEQKKRTGELEKFKYVLDYKIKELKKDMIPREAEIKSLKAQTTQEDNDLKDLNAYSNNLGLLVKKLQEQQKDLNANIEDYKVEVTEQEYNIKNFKKEIYSCVHDVKRFPELVERLKKLNKNPQPMNEIDADINQEYESQLKYLLLSNKYMNENLRRKKKEGDRKLELGLDENNQLLHEDRELGAKIQNFSETTDRSIPVAKAGNLAKKQEEEENNIRNIVAESEHILSKIDKISEDLKRTMRAKPEGFQRLIEEFGITFKTDERTGEVTSSPILICSSLQKQIFSV